MKSGKLHSSPRIGLIFYIAVSLLCGTMAENALGQVPPGYSPGYQNGTYWGPTTGGGSTTGQPQRVDQYFPPPAPAPKGPPECVRDILGQCNGAIDTETPGADQVLAAMFSGLCKKLGESCKSLIATCTEGEGNKLRRSLNMILDKTGLWCLVDPQSVVDDQNKTYRENCLVSGRLEPKSTDLCKVLVPATRFQPGYPCICTATVSKPGQIIVPETQTYACAQKYLKTLSECNSCCSTAGAKFFPDEDVRAKWLLDCQGSCENYPRG
jgi:hypothetical protein